MFLRETRITQNKRKSYKFNEMEKNINNNNEQQHNIELKQEVINYVKHTK